MPLNPHGTGGPWQVVTECKVIVTAATEAILGEHTVNIPRSQAKLPSSTISGSRSDKDVAGDV